MSRSAASIEIAAPAAEVFPWLVESERRLQWVDGLVASEELGGGRYGETLEAAGRRVDVTSEIVDRDEPRRLEVRSEGGGVTALIAHRLEESDGATTVTSSLELKLSGLLRFAGGLAASQAQRSLEASLARLKQLLEPA
jgi:uncharacterized protein YndB with AHSA1/START domain